MCNIGTLESRCFIQWGMFYIQMIPPKAPRVPCGGLCFVFVVVSWGFFLPYIKRENAHRLAPWCGQGHGMLYGLFVYLIDSFS